MILILLLFLKVSKNVSNHEINSNGKKKVALMLLVSPVFDLSCIGQSTLEWPALWQITMNSLHNKGIYK
jgi:hypothetical protein